MASEVSIKPVIWLGSSRKDLREFPAPVRVTWLRLVRRATRGKHREPRR